VRARAIFLGALLTASGAAAKERDPQSDLFQGFLVPANATDIYAPEFSFKVSGWQSNWGNVKLLEIAADGKEVKAGDVVARFDFGAKDALRWINERIARAQADLSQGRVNGDQTVESRGMDERRKQIESQLAGLNVQKERAVSKIQGDVYKIARKLAEFEVDAARQRLESARAARNAERAHLEKALERTKEDLARYQYYEKRFTVRAPHDGVVRHAFNSRERRKVQKGDGISAGMKLMSVAKDPTLAVRFFVPEHRVAMVRAGLELTVSSVASAEEFPAVARTIDFFPQEIGFLLENEELPNGREKAFQIKGELLKAPEGVSAGTEVRVKVKTLDVTVAP
jgi:biotin carboxyl carrier protein